MVLLHALALTLTILVALIVAERYNKVLRKR